MIQLSKQKQRIQIAVASLAALAILGTLPARATDDPHITQLAATSNAPLLLSTAPGAERFRPVGKLMAASHCTATLIAGEGPVDPQRPALILTAGHCAAHDLGDNNAIVDAPADSAWRYTPAYFIDTQPAHTSFAVERVLYATMKSIDLAVMQLDATYGDLAAVGIAPMRLEPTATTIATPIELTHVPIIGVPDEERYLRHSLCTANEARRLFEDRHPWFWTSAVPNDCEGVAGGTSGSPVVLRDRASVIGVLNTTVDESNGCGSGRPCELVEGEGMPREGSSYFIPIDSIARAFTTDGIFDVDLLDPGSGIALTRTGHWSTRELVADAEGNMHPAIWNLQASTQFDELRYKVGFAQTLDCAITEGYSAALRTTDQPLINLPTPTREGIYGMCIVGRTNGDSDWQKPEYASVKLRQIDETPPTLTPLIAVLRETEEKWDVYGATQPSEVSSVQIKFGPRATTDCDVDEGYHYADAHWETLSRARAPWRFCARGADLAGNPSPVTWRDFE
ncbi:V8-like Glu-specific endopeptidase [Luteibacter rhizovicinus]|uniref:V8-like Glu-specific endopeptidase n=1 Tax=Luteibacter rhizovicinus TaxID=242606 RepID=A0A4V2W4F6_9GAMM|nr:trypsin-like peptidase domain-containing protein [Luteibacter rhizovicinus]TCV95699.1 V8-like Glu-specific endopeptidase [Luteibacter rhizovicinus]